MFAPFWEAYDAITAEFVGETDGKALVEGAIKGMFEALGDPIPRYMTSDEYRSSICRHLRQFEGIGAVMMTQASPVRRPASVPARPATSSSSGRLRDSPAARAGLRKDDRIVAVDDAPVDGLTIDETVDRVRGPRGIDGPALDRARPGRDSSWRSSARSSRRRS